MNLKLNFFTQKDHPDASFRIRYAITYKLNYIINNHIPCTPSTMYANAYIIIYYNIPESVTYSVSNNRLIAMSFPCFFYQLINEY